MKHVIIGAGIAGTCAAEQLRMQDRSSEIVMIGDEEYYFRAALSKYFQGKIDRGELPGKPDGWYEANLITFVRDRVSRIEPEQSRVVCEGGGMVSYERLLIATGAEPVMIDWPGNDLDGVCTYRSRDCVDRFLRNVDGGAKRAVVIGAGILGVELVEDFRRLGLEVTLLVRGNKILNLLFDGFAAGMITEQMKADGIDIRFETEAREFVGEGGKLTGVVTKTGERIPSDVAAVAIGIKPGDRILEGTGIEFGRAILVDGHLATSVPNVYAAGDCCAVKYPGAERYVPTRTWLTAALQGQTAALNMLGRNVIFDEGVFFNVSHVYDSFYGVLGEFNPREPAGYEFRSWMFPDGGYMRWTLQEGVIVGTIIVDAMKYIWQVRQLIECGIDVSKISEEGVTETDLFLLLPQEKQTLF